MIWRPPSLPDDDDVDPKGLRPPSRRALPFYPLLLLLPPPSSPLLPTTGQDSGHRAWISVLSDTLAVDRSLFTLSVLVSFLTFPFLSYCFPLPSQPCPACLFHIVIPSSVCRHPLHLIGACGELTGRVLLLQPSSSCSMPLFAVLLYGTTPSLGRCCSPVRLPSYPELWQSLLICYHLQLPSISTWLSLVVSVSPLSSLCEFTLCAKILRRCSDSLNRSTAVDMCRKEALTGRVWFELLWVGVFWVLELCTLCST